MGYYKIGEKPIFITHKQRMEFAREFGKNKDDLWIFGTIMEGSASDELDNLILDHLENAYSKDKDTFLDRYYTFDFKKVEASDQVWNIIYDYSIYYGKRILRDTRDFTEKIVNETSVFTHPMGTSFDIVFIIPGKKSLLKPETLQQEIVFHIDSDKVTRITGSIEKFTLTTESGNLSFSKDLISWN